MKIATVTIRKARPADHDAILKLDAACFRGDEPITIHPDDAWWIGHDDYGNPACFAGAQEWTVSDSGSKLTGFHIHRMGVLPSFRGLGLQARSLRAQCSEAKRRNYDEVWSYTAHDNTHSVNTFIRCGFTTWLPYSWDGWRKPWKPEGDHGWIYWRREL